MNRLLCAVVAAAVCVSASCRQPAPPPPAPVSPDTWAAVDGKAITKDEVEKAFRRASNGTQPPSEEEALTAKLSLLEELIAEEILLSKARTLKIDVPDSEVETAYGNAKKNIPDDQFQQELSKRNLTVADMRDGLRRQLLAQKVIEREVTSKVAVSDQQITDFFNANRAQFNLPEDAFHLAQIVVTPVRDQQITNRTGDDATTPQQAAQKVGMLMERLKGGATFSSLAADYSEDPDSAARAGDLGLVPMSAVKQAPAPLRDAVLQVPVGSARIVNQNGILTIVYVVSKETAGQRDLSMPEVRQRITDTLKGRREQLLRTAYVDAARSDATIVNYLAKRVVESQGLPGGPPSAPLTKPAAPTK